MITCKNCKYLKKELCFIYPPAVVQTEHTSQKYMFVYPEVYIKTKSCGEYKYKYE